MTKTVITIENGRVTVEVDDGAEPVIISGERRDDASIHIPPPMVVPVEPVSEPAAPLAEPGSQPPKRTILPPALKKDSCGFCRRRGEPCVRHGGVPANSNKLRAFKKTAKVSMVARTDDAPTKREGFIPKDDRPPVKVFSETGKFLDPWNCQACRDLGRLCGIHKYMTDSGKKPPIRVESD